jgi:hypothetical protein
MSTYANHIRADYPALAAYHDAVDEWCAGPVGPDGLLVGDGPTFEGTAAERDYERKRRDDKTRERYHREYQAQFSPNDYI